MNRILFFVTLFLSTSVTAQYRSNGPNGGVVNTFYRLGGRIWLASNTGIYFSDNNSLSWNNSSTPVNSFNCEPVLSVAAAGGEVYAGTPNSGIYFSADNGSTWNTVNNGLKTVGANYKDLEISGPNVFAIRADSGLLLTTNDRGVSWRTINPLIGSAVAHWLSLRNNELYVSTNLGIFMSNNNGISFMNINSTVTNGKLVWVNDTAYAATNNGILQSTDLGMSFNPLGLTGRNATNVSVIGNRLFASVRGTSSQDTIKYSGNGGISFSNAPFSSFFQFRNVLDMLAVDTTVLAGTDYGLFYSSNGTAWSARDSGFRSTAIRGLAYSGSTVYTASSPLGIFVSTDSGTNWLHRGDRNNGVEDNILSIAAAGPYVYAGGSTNYYRSNDYGATWTQGATGLSGGNTPSVYALKTTTNVVLIQNGNLLFSSNNGVSYAPIPGSALPGGASYYVTGADTGLFVATYGGLYRASLSALSFAPTVGISGNVSSVVHSGTAYYASTSGNGLYKSANGISWIAETIVSPDSLPAKINVLAVDSGSLIAGTDVGLYSNKGGAWHRDSLEGKTVFSLAVRNGYVFAGTCGGVWSKPYPPVTPPTIGVSQTTRASKSVVVYPNPAKSSFRISMIAARSGKVELVLKNMIGATLMNQTHKARSGGNDFTVSTDDLATGVYLLQISGAGINECTRVVVNR